MVKKKIKSGKIIWLLSNQSGMALLTTLIFVFILVTFGVALLTMTSNDIQLSALQRDSTKAFYLAEAGIQRAIKELHKNFSWQSVFNNEPFGDGNYTVEALGFNEGDGTIPENHVRIISTGKVNRPEREIIVFVKEAPHPIFNYAIATKGRLELQNKEGGLTGDVYCDGIIKNGEHVIVDGKGVATIDFEECTPEILEEILLWHPEFLGGTLKGEQYRIEDFPTVPSIDGFPELDMDTLEALAGEPYLGGGDLVTGELDGLFGIGGLHVEGDLVVDGDSSLQLSGKVIYVTGNVHFKETTIIGPGIIVAEGTITIDNDSVCGLPNSDDSPSNPKAQDLGIFSNSEANPAIKVVPSNTDIYGIFYAPNGYIYISTNGTVHGSIVAGGPDPPDLFERPAEIQATGGIHWTSNTSTDIFMLFSIASWQEGY